MFKARQKTIRKSLNQPVGKKLVVEGRKQP